MEITPSLLFLQIFLLSAVALILPLSQRRRRRNGSRPPGPPGWPVFGNIFDLGTIPHQTLYFLRPKYGPVIWLKLGSVNTLVIRSAKAATELFKNHDQVFCDRRCPDSMTVHNYNQGALAIGRYGSYWRMIRRLCTAEIMVNRRLNETVYLRRKCIDNMIQNIEKDVEIRDPRSKEGREFFNAMGKVAEWSGKPNISDFFPVLKWLDPQGIKRNMERDLGIAMKIISKFVKQRMEEKKLGEEMKTKDFLDALLEYQREGKDGAGKLTEQNVFILILEMFFAGSETSNSSIEWAMAELLRHPESMREVKEELDRVIGPNRKVEESDTENLPYLQAVIKETLRLHPAVPLMLPRNAMEERNFMGYVIPKDTQIWVNAWAIGRDPDAWEDPFSFIPERFLSSKIDYKGQNFELLPFGSGRRICVGLLLAHRVIHLALASLLHHFDWELPINTTPKDLDMNERMGMAIRKLVPRTESNSQEACNIRKIKDDDRRPQYKVI
ncbi:hypothetical protein SLEP1_g45597 [Rubroshorea leprosula]|uniref:Cytochrome P450 n=1 Tax=Rubroshorea leprosula TaxID=152421 RepID=A0AAV5LJM1_9ROSI|nr:hypothetical protein SLEP1_g45597 [Rubroshorea leprosula]